MMWKYLEQNVLSQKVWSGYNFELADLAYRFFSDADGD